MDTKMEHLRRETKALPMLCHLRLRISQLRRQAQHPSHLLCDLTLETECPRKKRQTIFLNWKEGTINVKNGYIIPLTPEMISLSLRTVHASMVAECLRSCRPNPHLSYRAPEMCKSEQTLPRCAERALAQLRSGGSPVLQKCLRVVNPSSHLSPLCPLCGLRDHSAKYLFNCKMIHTSLTLGDLWSNPVAVADLLQLWTGCHRRRSEVRPAMRPDGHQNKKQKKHSFFGMPTLGVPVGN